MGCRRLVVVLAIGLTSLAGFACGGGDSNPDARPVSLFDAPPPDASVPDAFVCVETATRKACGAGMAGCVDITRDNQHCGGCNMACPSGGQACVPGAAADGDAGVGNDVAHCECPPQDFVPAVINPLDLSQFGVEPVNQIPGGTEYVGLGPYLAGSLVHVVVGTFDLAATPSQIGVDIDLSTVASDAVAPRVVAGYNLDLMSQSVQTAYTAVSGTLNYEWACATGVSGTLTDATFAEVNGLMDPTPAPNGCGFSVTSVSFTFGECVDGDAGTGGDAGSP